MELTNQLDNVDAPHSLTFRQQEFCIQYILHHGNKARAARSAGYALHNSSAIGCRLLQRADIQEYISLIWKKAAELSRTQDLSRVAHEMSFAKNKAVISLAEFWMITSDSIRLRKLDELTPHAIRMIKDIELGERGELLAYKFEPGQLNDAFKKLASFANKVQPDGR